MAIWEYALLTQQAKLLGGPAKFMNAIVQTGVKKGIAIGFNQGVKVGIKTGKIKMIPLVVGAATVGAIVGGIVVSLANDEKDSTISTNNEEGIKKSVGNEKEGSSVSKDNTNKGDDAQAQLISPDDETKLNLNCSKKENEV